MHGIACDLIQLEQFPNTPIYGYYAYLSAASFYTYRVTCVGGVTKQILHSSCHAMHGVAV